MEGCLGAIVGVLRYGHTTEAREHSAATLFSLSAVHDYKKEIAEEEGGVEALARMLIEGTSRGMMRYGTPRGKENAVAALLELCKSGGATATERVLRAPVMASLLQSLLCSGTKRARRKAASLARVFQRCENSSLHYAGYAFARGNAVATREASFRRRSSSREFKARNKYLEQPSVAVNTTIQMTTN